MPRGILVGVGNPLLDMTVTGNPSLLAKYHLQEDDAIIAGPKQTGLFDELISSYSPRFQAGGATQNSIRVAQWLLQSPGATIFFGCVGNDDRAEILRSVAKEAGVDVHYQVNDTISTGVCAAIISGENRSLVAQLGAADYFQHEWVEQQKWDLIKQAQFFYIGGFVFPVCNQVIFDIARHAAETKKTLIMNLSATYLCKYYADMHLDILPYIDILFGNGKEATEFCRLRNIDADNVGEMALKISAMPKANSDRERICVFTNGNRPAVAATKGEVTEHPIVRINRKEIRDTNGCGDAFVGGFLSQLVQGKPLSECLRCGFYAGSVVVRHWGCSYPEKHDFH